MAPTPLPSSIRVSGRVLDAEAQPVASATVTGVVVDTRATYIVESGPDGRYAFTVDASSLTSRFAELGLIVGRHDLETGRYAVWLGGLAEVRKDLLAHRVARVTVGEQATFRMTPADPVCSFEGEYYPCRRLRVVSPVAGALSVAVAGSLVEGYNAVLMYQDRQDRQFWLDVPAGETTFDIIALNTQTGRDITIETSERGPEY